jgi:hypothetical protein
METAPMTREEVEQHVAITKQELATWPKDCTIHEFLKGKQSQSGRGYSVGIPGHGWWFGLREFLPGHPVAFLDIPGVWDEESEILPARKTNLQEATDWIRRNCKRLLAETPEVASDEPADV